MLPPAPPRLSTMKVCPSSGPSFWVSVRATMSTVPPAANGTRMVTGFVGHSCAPAGNVNAASAAHNQLRIERIAAHLFVIELDSEPGPLGQFNLASAEVELHRHDVIRGLQRSDALQPIEHRAGRGGQHDLRDRVHAQTESVPDHHAEARGGSRLEHAAAFEEAALLHHLQLHDVGAIGA